MKDDEKPIWIFMNLTTILTIPTIFILGLVIGINVNSNVQKKPIDIAAWLGASATVVIALLTLILAAESWRLRRNQDAQIENIRKESIQPQIEFFIEQSATSFQFFNLRVENVGKGVARDISFRLITRNKCFLASEDYLISKLDTIGFFKNKISVLGIGKSRSSFLFSFIDFSNAFGEKAFEPCLSFEILCYDSENNSYTAKSVIDLSEFKGMSEVGVDPIYESYEELKKIRQSIGSIISNKRLNIDIPTEEELERDVRKHLNI